MIPGQGTRSHMLQLRVLMLQLRLSTAKLINKNILKNKNKNTCIYIYIYIIYLNKLLFKILEKRFFFWVSATKAALGEFCHTNPGLLGASLSICRRRGSNYSRGFHSNPPPLPQIVSLGTPFVEVGVRVGLERKGIWTPLWYEPTSLHQQLCFLTHIYFYVE